MASSTEEQSDIVISATDPESSQQNATCIMVDEENNLESESQAEVDVSHGTPHSTGFTITASDVSLPRDMASEFSHHAVEEGVPSAGSAFHVVSHSDGHKELVAGTPEHSTSSRENSSLPPFSTRNTGIAEGESQVKHFSAHIVEQHGQQNELVNSTEQHDQVTELSELKEENELLLLSKEKPEVDNEDIDEAVEKALLADEPGINPEKKQNSENMDVSEISSDSKQGPHFEFIKPETFHTIEALPKHTVVLGNNTENDVESELRKQSKVPSHLPEKVFDIDEETRMGLDQTPVDSTVLGSSFTYPSLPPKKLFHLDDTKDSDPSDIETKLSTMTDTEDIRLINTISVDDATKDSAASDSNAEAPTPRKQRRASKEGASVTQVEGLEIGERVFSAENLFEYQWPLDGGEWHLLQEQVSEYLKVKSFKRKYPDLYRRTCDKEEKDFLREKGVVTETQSDLGLTALRSEEVYDLMMKDYNVQYKEYIAHLQEKQKKVIREKHKEYSAAKLDKTKIEAYSKKAARSAAEFNASLMRDKKEERKAYFDLQTFTIHFPKNKFKTLPPQYTKVGAYPVSLVAGQYQEYYKKFKPEELKYLPVKTVLQDPPRLTKYIRPPPSGVKVVSTEKQKIAPGSDGEGSSSSEDEEDGLESLEMMDSDALETRTPVLDDGDLRSIKLEKRSKSSLKKKAAKLGVSPDKLKKLGIKKLKDIEMDDRASQDGDDKESPGGSKMPAKIHGLEKCRICKKRSTKEERKAGKLVKCAECGKIGHMSCLDLTEELVAVIKTYPWQCMECKTCIECLDPYDEDKMMFCDRCDRGYHTFCIGLSALPTGHWECKSCEGFPKITPKHQHHRIALDFPQAVPYLKPELEIKLEDEVAPAVPGCAVFEEKLDTPLCQVVEQPVKVVRKGDLITETPIKVVRKGDLITETPIKVEKRGRKRKLVDGPPAEPKATPERIKGERQSRRLKLKEEEEEEKKRKELESKSEKKVKKRKKMKPGEEVVVLSDVISSQHQDDIDDSIDMVELTGCDVAPAVTDEPDISADSVATNQCSLVSLCEPAVEGNSHVVQVLLPTPGLCQGDIMSVPAASDSPSPAVPAEDLQPLTGLPDDPSHIPQVASLGGQELLPPNGSVDVPMVEHAVEGGLAEDVGGLTSPLTTVPMSTSADPQANSQLQQDQVSQPCPAPAQDPVPQTLDPIQPSQDLTVPCADVTVTNVTVQNVTSVAVPSEELPAASDCCLQGVGQQPETHPDTALCETDADAITS